MALNDDEFLTIAAGLKRHYFEVDVKNDPSLPTAAHLTPDGRLVDPTVILRGSHEHKGEYVVVAPLWPEGCASHASTLAEAQQLCLNGVMRCLETAIGQTPRMRLSGLLEFRIVPDHLKLLRVN